MAQKATTDHEDSTGNCPNDHPYCEGADSPAEKPELCMDCWHEWAAYDEQERIANSTSGDESDTPEDGDSPSGADNSDQYGYANANINRKDTCLLPGCDNDTKDGYRNGFCVDHTETGAIIDEKTK